MEKFESQIFRFSSGVVVDLNENKLIAKADNGSTSIDAKNIDNVKYIKFTQPRLSVIGMITRTLIGGCLLALFIDLIFVNDEWGAIFFDASIKDIFFGWLAIIIFVGSFLLAGFIWFVFVFDAFLETGLYEKFILRFFADRGYAVTIGNKSGNNASLFAMESDLPKLKKLETAISDLKHFLENKQPLPQQSIVTPTPEQNIKPSSTTQLDDLKKLGDLYQSGILTKEEFEKKKVELLNQ